MTLQDLIDSFRQRADDAVAPYHVDDPVLAKFASEAEREACIRANLIRDTTTTDYAAMPVTAGTAIYELDPLVQAIDSASFQVTGTTRWEKVTPTGMDRIEDNFDWQNKRASRPCSLVHLSPERSIRLWPTPSMDGTLQLAVYRLPLFDMEDGEDEPEIPIEHHDGLVSWMLYRAYSTKDSELEDPDRAQANLSEFTARFGPRDTADVLRRHRERRRYTTRYGGL